MSRSIFVHLLPGLFEPAELVGGVAVVLDVLRATSTIVYALAAGVKAVIPCGEIDDARRIAAQSPPGTVLLGGERHGLKISGFDLGNSPTDYTPPAVAGKTLIFTTTNGTRALIRARAARRVLVGAFLNLGVVVRLLANETGPVHIVCAGTDGQVTLEDVLCAGAIAHGLGSQGIETEASDDSTQLALNLFETCGRDYNSLVTTLRQSRGGRNLIDCSLGADIFTCAQQDKFEIVPELALAAWEIHAAL